MDIYIYIYNDISKYVEHFCSSTDQGGQGLWPCWCEATSTEAPCAQAPFLYAKF